MAQALLGETQGHDAPAQPYTAPAAVTKKTPRNEGPLS